MATAIRSSRFFRAFPAVWWLLLAIMNEDYQVENGKFTRIINKTLDDLIGAKMNGVEYTVCLFIVRKTWGFNKKQDEISISQIVKATNKSRQAVQKALKKLQLGNKITLVSKGNSKKSANIYKYNKYWQLGNQSTLDKVELGNKVDIQLGNKIIPTKDSITKDSIPEIIISGNSMKNTEPEGYEEIDKKTGEIIRVPIQSEPLKEKRSNSMVELLAWAVHRRGANFTAPKKQLAAMKRMKDAGIKPDQVKDRWIELEDDKFWKDKLDFGSVAMSFDQKPA